jgi:hypothetical protein
MCWRQASSGSSASRRSIGVSTSHRASMSSLPRSRRATPSGRSGNEGPVHLPAPGHRVQGSGNRHVVLPRARRIDVVEQLRVGVAPEDDVGAASLEALLDLAIPPPWGEPERSLIGVQQPRALDVLIPVENAHVVGTGAIGHLRDLARQRSVLDVVHQDHDFLAFSDVRPEMHREPRQRPGALLVKRR